MPEPTEKLIIDPERRRSPRFSCRGLAKIICLPSDGIFLHGKILDLSLGGCGVETPKPLIHGAIAEIMVRIHGSCFRALGQVRAVHGSAGNCMQFLQLSSGGRDMLAELVRELARQQAIANVVRNARQEPDQEFLGEHRSAVLAAGIPLIRVTPDAESTAPDSLAVSRTALVVDGDIDLLI